MVQIPKPFLNFAVRSVDDRFQHLGLHLKRIPRNEDGGVTNVFSIEPDWAIEILSRDQSQTKVAKNTLHCLKHQTQMDWLIDPA